MTVTEALEKLKTYEQTSFALGHAMGLLYYDGVTVAPKGAAAVRGPFRAESRPQGFRTGNRVVLPGPHRGDTLPCQGGQEIRPVRLGAAGTAAP